MEMTVGNYTLIINPRINLYICTYTCEHNWRIINYFKKKTIVYIYYVF